jgi:simple sugar transport system ATP-binding protein
MMAKGIGRIPEDSRANVIGQMTVAQNMVLEKLDQFSRKGTLDRQSIGRYAETLIRDYQIKASPNDQMRTLSGGNLQKVVLARVLAQKPKVLGPNPPGLDVGATEMSATSCWNNAKELLFLISEDSMKSCSFRTPSRSCTRAGSWT